MYFIRSISSVLSSVLQRAGLERCFKGVMFIAKIWKTEETKDRRLLSEMQIPTHREAAVLVALKQTETQHVYFNHCSIGMGFKKKTLIFFFCLFEACMG